MLGLSVPQARFGPSATTAGAVVFLIDRSSAPDARVPYSEMRSLALTSVPRYLGLDVGAKRIGVAVSDELGLTAQPVLTLEVHRNPRDDLRSIGRLARRFSVAAIVVGNPLHLSGETSPRAEKVQQFAVQLGELTGLPIHLWDERLTTREAHQLLYESGRARQDHKKVVDQVAAVLILQSFLDSRRPHNP
jgi:putative Holliday junction resolvase